MWEPSRTSYWLVTAMHRANYVLVAVLVAGLAVQLYAKSQDLRIPVSSDRAFLLLTEAVAEEGLKVQSTDPAAGMVRTEHPGTWHPIVHRLIFVVTRDGADSSRIGTSYETGSGDRFTVLPSKDLNFWEQETVANVLARVRGKAPSSTLSPYGIERLAMSIVGLLSCISLILYWLYFLLNPVAEARAWLREFAWSAVGLTVVTAIVLIVFVSMGSGEPF